MSKKKSILWLLKLSAVLVFLGRGWTHLLWDAPYRTFFWDEDLLKIVIEGLTNMTWKDYVTSPSVDGFIQNAIKITGWFYFTCAVAAIFIKTNRGLAVTFSRRNKILGYVLISGSIMLTVLAVLYCKENFFNLGQFFEYSIQASAPFFLYLAIFRFDDLSKLLLPLKVVIALTFICHGLYAYGYYPRPGVFVDMTLSILSIEESTAHLFLKVAGVLDFITAAMLFIPRLARPALWYMIVWGFLTALARIVANWYPEFPMDTFGFWLWETIYRLPHGLIPLTALLILKQGHLPIVKTA